MHRNVNGCTIAWRITGALEIATSAVRCTSWITIGCRRHGETSGSEVNVSRRGGEVDLSLGFVMASQSPS
jgi:hypothetical protein